MMSNFLSFLCPNVHKQLNTIILSFTDAMMLVLINLLVANYFVRLPYSGKIIFFLQKDTLVCACLQIIFATFFNRLENHWCRLQKIIPFQFDQQSSKQNILDYFFCILFLCAVNLTDFFVISKVKGYNCCLKNYFSLKCQMQ